MAEDYFTLKNKVYEYKGYKVEFNWVSDGEYINYIITDNEGEHIFSGKKFDGVDCAQREAKKIIDREDK